MDSETLMEVEGALLEQVVDGLAGPGYAVVDGFLTSTEVSILLELLSWHEGEGRLRRAGIGTADTYQVEKAVRGDLIRWIDPAKAAEPTLDFLAKVNRLMGHINRTCFLGLKDFEAHFTMYPKGAFYRRHLDQFRDRPHRRISLVCYLNQQWRPAHGGELRMFVPSGNGEAVVDIAPKGGRLVCFRSDLLEHEVLPVQEPRCNITGWMLDTPAGLTFL